MKNGKTHSGLRLTAVAMAIAALLVFATGCASINRNANAVVFGGILGAAGGVAGFAATNGNGEGAAAGAATGAAIGGAIGHQIDRLIWRKEAERTHAVCPYCHRSVYVGEYGPGQQAHCPKCGRRFQVSEKER